MEHFFDSRDSASREAAARIPAALRKRLDKQSAASLVVSGGTTPVQCFHELAQHDLDWQRVGVIASDERWLPGDHDDSNEKLIRDEFLVDKAANAELLPFYAAHESVEERAASLDKILRFAPFPFASSLLGMGTDGHFASLFPDADNLKEGLDLEGEKLCIAVSTAASPYARISLTLAALSRSDEIVLLFFGDEKRDVYEEAKKDNDRYPVSRLLRQKRAPVHIYWAP